MTWLQVPELARCPGHSLNLTLQIQGVVYGLLYRHKTNALPPPSPAQLPGAPSTSEHATAPPKGAASPRTGTVGPAPAGTHSRGQRILPRPSARRALGSPGKPTPAGSSQRALLQSAPGWGARPKDPAPPGSGADSSRGGSVPHQRQGVRDRPGHLPPPSRLHGHRDAPPVAITTRCGGSDLMTPETRAEILAQRKRGREGREPAHAQSARRAEGRWRGRNGGVRPIWARSRYPARTRCTTAPGPQAPCGRRAVRPQVLRGW